jgi:trans-2,3-dihydro-3-hydroxyanthranilate isomerase
MVQVKSYRYAVVDVFTTEPLAGNPLAVFPDASEFDETTMQKIARTDEGWKLDLPRS